MCSEGRACFRATGREETGHFMPSAFNQSAIPSGTAVQAASAAVSGTGTAPRSGSREAFGPEELAIVLSHFDIGVIDSIVELPARARARPPSC